MKINLREDSVEIEGYVNAVERNSKPLLSRIGHFIERICKGAFKKALKRNEDVRILLNHDWKRDLGGTADGNLELEEDNIGLHAKAKITDPEVIEKARNGDLVGWSFGFTDRDVANSIEKNMPVREVKDLNLFEVSILDRTKTPAYDGTLIYARDMDGEKEMIYRGEDNIEEPEVKEETEQKPNTEEPVDQPEVEDVEEPKEEPQEEVKTESEPVENASEEPVENISKTEQIDYTKYEQMISEMKSEA